MAGDIPTIKPAAPARPVHPAAAPAPKAPPAPAGAAHPSEAKPQAGDQDLTASPKASQNRSKLAWERFQHQESTGARQAADEAADHDDHHRAGALYTTAAHEATTQRDALDAAKAANEHVHGGFLGLSTHGEYVDAVASGIDAAARTSKTFKESKETLDFALHQTSTQKITGHHYEPIDAATDEAAYQALGTARTKAELLQLKDMLKDYRSSNIVDEMSYTKEVLDDRLEQAD